ncbi:MAG: phospholipase [Luteitalea sp.]|nr:phospholipase [Luteitalea sp.]
MDPHAGQPIESAGAPLGQSRAAVIMIHGRGASPGNILELAPALGHPELTYLAPSAAGSTWYPFSFLADIQTNEPFLSSALGVIDRLVAGLLVKGIARERILLLGFSQGACLASEFAVRHPARYGGVVAFSGGLIGPPGTVWDEDKGRFEGTPVFLGCSDVDPHIPKARVDDSAGVFNRMGAEVTKRIYPSMGHLVNDDEIAFARSLIDGW